MIKHELYIDGLKMDLGDDFDIALLFQSFFFTDLANIVSNRSYNVKFPPTPNNLKTIGFSSLETVVSNFPFVLHNVEYIRNGYRIIKGGIAVVLAIETQIEIAFTWGSIQNFTGLGNDLISTIFDDVFVFMNEQFPFATNSSNYGLFQVDFGKGIDRSYMNISIKASFLLDKINAKYGLNIDIPNIDKYIIPLTTRNGSMFNYNESLSGYEVIGSGNSMVIYPKGSPNSSYFTPVMNSIFQTGIAFKNGGDVTFTPSFYNSVDTFNFLLNDTVITLNGVLQNGGNWNGYYHFTTPVKFNASAGDVLTFPYKSGEYDGFTLNQYPTEVTFNMSYSINGNLPELTPITFIKTFLSLEGIFAGYGDQIFFKSVDDLYANMPNAIDWTDKLVNETKGFSNPMRKEFNYNSFAQNNVLKWKDDSTVVGGYSGVITVNNKSLDDSKDLLTMTFAASDEKNGMAYIPLFDIDGKFTKGSPKILTLQGVVGRFLEPGYNLNFSGPDGIIARKYQGYQNIVEQINFCRVNCVLSDLDLFNMKMDIPVYFQQFGHYYAPLKIQVKANNLCQCDFLRL